MDRQQAKRVLKGMTLDGYGDEITIDGLWLSDPSTSWYAVSSTAVLDGSYTAEQLEAIAWWMRYSGEGE